MKLVVETILLGMGATAVMDLWGALRRPLFRMPAPDYAPVGRWVGHMLMHGRFRHASILASEPVIDERIIGWLVHYATGVAFAAALIVATNGEWLQHPSFAGALLTGILSLAAPFLVMQPAMGVGIAASRTPRPGRARLQSLITHCVFGAGLFLTGSLLEALRA